MTDFSKTFVIVDHQFLDKEIEILDRGKLLTSRVSQGVHLSIFLFCLFFNSLETYLSNDETVLCAC